MSSRDEAVGSSRLRLQVLSGTAHSLVRPGRGGSGTFYLWFSDPPVAVHMDAFQELPIAEGEAVAVAGRFGILRRSTFSALAYRRSGVDEVAHPANPWLCIVGVVFGMAGVFSLTFDPERGLVALTPYLFLVALGVGSVLKLYGMWAATQLLNRWSP